MKKTKALGLGLAIAAISAIAVATPAAAAPWPSNGEFTIPGTMGGGALWQLSEYGLQLGTNAANDMENGFGYPIEIYGEDYLDCGTGKGADSTVTEEANGDITIDCLPAVDSPAIGLTTTAHFRLYAAADTGYLAREWFEVTNTTGSEIDESSTPFELWYYYNADDWSVGDPYYSSLHGADSEGNGDAWEAVGNAGPTAGNVTATSTAWADPRYASGFVYDGAFESTYIYPNEANVFAAGETRNFVAFVNLVFPATNDAAGATGAYNTVVAQAQTEYSAGLTGRMAAGLPCGLEVFAWGQAPCPPTAALPNTGADTAVIGGIAAGAGALALLGLGLVVARRRARA